MENVLVLNADYQFLNFVDWQKAMNLLIQGKVEAIKYSDKVIHSVDRAFQVPIVVKLRKLSKMVFTRKVQFSKKNVFIRDKYICAYCGTDMSNDKKIATIDHIVPKKNGGKNSWTNCVTACYSCNNKKGNLPLEKFGKLQFRPFQPNVTQYIAAKLKLMGTNKILDDLFK